MWYSSSCGNITLQITKAEAATASHQGQCDADVLILSNKPRIKRQLDKLDKTTVVNELRGYGAWDDTELADHTQNLQRLLWLACGDITEGRG